MSANDDATRRRQNAERRVNRRNRNNSTGSDTSMTRKQAEKVADEIVKLARAKESGETRNTWTTTNVQITDELRGKIVENSGLVIGCLPMGWSIGGIRGHETLVVNRRL